MVGRIPNNKVSLEVRDNILNKSIYREYYEETVERKQMAQHAIVTKNYCLAKKNYQEFKRQTKQITKINRKQVTGPQWFQELSEQQISILDNLFNLMKEDFDLATAKSTRRALKALGVCTFIPHTVAMDALLKTELYLVDFLQIIKDYVIQKNNEKFCNRTISAEKKKDYLLEERILMSSILHIAYPCFIKRLEYFLKNAMPEKNLKYMKLPKSTKLTKKYASPYLEPLPEPNHTWAKVKKVKFHNKNVRKQKMFNKMKTIQLQQKLETEMHDEKNITMRMKITYPKNSVNKMFCKPPLLKQFNRENENILTPEIMSPIVKSYVYEDDTMQRSGDMQTTIGEEEEDVWSTISREFVENVTWRSRGWSTASNSSTVTENTTLYHSTKLIDTQQPPTHGNFLEKPFDCLHTDYEESNVSIDSISESSESTVMKTNPHKTVVVIDFDSSVDQFDCNMAIRDDGKNASGEQEDADESDDDAVLSEMLRDLNVMNMNADEDNICQVFRKYGASMVAQYGNSHQQQQQHPSVFSSGTGITVAKINRTKHVDTPSMKGMQGTPLRSVVGVAVKGQSSVITLGKKMSVLQLPPTDRDSNGVTVHIDDSKVVNESMIDGDCDHNVCTRELQPLINKDGSVNMTRLHAVIHKLPNWKQLRVVLKLMSIMGDPIANFPDIIELNKLRRWYEIRINVNRHMTSKIKQKLIIQSIKSWSTPRPKLTSVGVPNNPMHGENNIGVMKITWDQVNEIKRKINRTKDEYTFKLKRIAINNARTMYQTMHNDYYNNRLSRNFKQSYYDYFPAKENDCLFKYVADIKKT
ncbi:uncharacterized protein LOC132926100 [Rhopalosiphum padi]|uniref:uncharacterized protein LOC132926100 n=1 Tax=Rhopalosiphum padi TaxID=40932 RepID=UPI00298E94D3|nr:uncharacterized protein LOC132926100 [Rhopalosiphum padi]